MPRPSVQMAKSLMPLFTQPASSSVTHVVGSIAIWPALHWPAVRSQPAWLGALMPSGPKVNSTLEAVVPKTCRWWFGQAAEIVTLWGLARRTAGKSRKHHHFTRGIVVKVHDRLALVAHGVLDVVAGDEAALCP